MLRFLENINGYSPNIMTTITQYLRLGTSYLALNFSFVFHVFKTVSFSNYSFIMFGRVKYLLESRYF